MCAACRWDRLPTEWCPCEDNAKIRNKHYEIRQQRAERSSGTRQGPPPPPSLSMLSKLQKTTSAGSTATPESSAVRSPARSRSSDNVLHQLLYGQSKLIQEIRDMKTKIASIEEQIKTNHETLEARIAWKTMD